MVCMQVSYRFFELTNTLKTAFVPSKDDRRLAYNVITAGAISICLYSVSFVLLQIPRMMVSYLWKLCCYVDVNCLLYA